MKIWLDDVREPPDDTWEWAISFTQLRYILRRYNQPPTSMSFDHDLGLDRSTMTDHMSGHEIIKWLAETYPEWYPETVTVHSANPVGAGNIRAYDMWYRRMLSEDRPET